MEERRASRIASYMEGSIQDSPERLLELRDWAVQAALDMHDHLLAEARRLG
jgi:DNA-nicking Smr family endonuclease